MKNAIIPTWTVITLYLNNIENILYSSTDYGCHIM